MTDIHFNEQARGTMSNGLLKSFTNGNVERGTDSDVNKSNGTVPNGFSTSEVGGQDHQNQNGHAGETIVIENGHGAKRGFSRCPSSGSVVQCLASSKNNNGREVVLAGDVAVPDTNGNNVPCTGSEIMRIEVAG